MAAKQIKSNHHIKASDILMALKPVISAEDRKNACDKFHLSNATIGNYLAGDVCNLGIAEKLIVFFKECVVRREQLFNQLAQPIG